MNLSIVVAASTNNVIGKDGTLPWHLSEDLKNFKKITMGKPIVMGRATWESIGRALPGRKNIVLSRNPALQAPGCEVVTNLSGALEAAGDADEVMIIGGGQIYLEALPVANRIYLTRVEREIDGDTFFPALDINEWNTLKQESYPVNEDRKIAFEIVTLERI